MKKTIILILALMILITGCGAGEYQSHKLGEFKQYNGNTSEELGDDTIKQPRAGEQQNKEGPPRAKLVENP